MQPGWRPVHATQPNSEDASGRIGVGGVTGVLASEVTVARNAGSAADRWDSKE